MCYEQILVEMIRVTLGVNFIQKLLWEIIECPALFKLFVCFSWTCTVHLNLCWSHGNGCKNLWISRVGSINIIPHFFLLPNFKVLQKWFWNKRPMGLDTLLIWWPVKKGLVIKHLLCRQEADTANHCWLKANCLQCNFLQENWNLIHKS